MAAEGDRSGIRGSGEAIDQVKIQLDSWLKRDKKMGVSRLRKDVSRYLPNPCSKVSPLPEATQRAVSAAAWG